MESRLRVGPLKGDLTSAFLPGLITTLVAERLYEFWIRSGFRSGSREARVITLPRDLILTQVQLVVLPPGLVRRGVLVRFQPLELEDLEWVNMTFVTSVLRCIRW